MEIKVQKTVQHQDRTKRKENVLRTFLVQGPAGVLAKTRYLHGFQYYDNVLQFFHISTPLNAGTPEGYVKNTPDDTGTPSFDYVYQYKDHASTLLSAGLGNVRVNYAQDPVTGDLSILEENHYYPFGLQHSNYNSDLAVIKRDEQSNEKSLAQDTHPTNPFANPGYKYKYQGQERQDEFGLNWDSFKWRNYDYAIGRFMSIDPLAEEYAYNSPYAFQENKMGLGRELEGLELVSERNKDGKSITLTYNVKPVNNTQRPDGSTMLSSGDFNNLVQTRADQTESTFSGQTANGETVTTNVVFDDNATIVWEYNTMIDIEGTATGNEAYGQMSPGKTTEVGNTQENRTQVNVYSHFGENGELNITPGNTNEATRTGTHEDAHVGGIQHNNVSNNIGNPNGTGTNMTPAQRSEVIKNVEEQQKN